MVWLRIFRTNRDEKCQVSIVLTNIKSALVRVFGRADSIVIERTSFYLY